jgi:hypothetical protein
MMSDDVIFAIAFAKAAIIVASATGLLVYLAWAVTKATSPRRHR